MTDNAEIVQVATGTIVTYASAEQNPARVYIASLSEGSKGTMFSALATIAAYLSGSRPSERYPKDWADNMRRQAQEEAIDATPWHRLRFQHTMALRNLLAEDYEACTANKMLTALRQTIKTAWRLKLMDTDDYMRAVDIASIKGELPEAATGRALTKGEIAALIQSGDDGTNLGARDTAIIALAIGGGLRRSELAHLQLSNYNDGALTIVKGKRNKTRIVPLPAGARDALDDWILMRGQTAGPLFVRVLKGDHVHAEGLTPHAMQLILDARRKAANIKHFTPHDLRRTFAGDLLDAGVDIVTVQKLLGHSSPATTASYDRRGKRAREEAVTHIHVPYKTKGTR
jgi:integrase/recombinase XerC